MSDTKRLTKDDWIAAAKQRRRARVITRDGHEYVVKLIGVSFETSTCVVEFPGSRVARLPLARLVGLET
jgi:hypothetical protein